MVAATEHESRFGLVVVVTRRVGNLMRADWPGEGLAVVGRGRSHSSFSIECVGCQDSQTLAPKDSGPKRAVVSFCNQFEDECDLQQSVALEGGSKTLCFRWPRARECDGDPTGQRRRRGRP